MNPYGVNELYMHSQRDPNCSQIRLGSSHATMGGFGCYVVACAYLASRVLGRDVQPLELVTWLNAHGGFKPDGSLIWKKIEEFTGGKLRMFTTNPLLSFGKAFTTRLVSYAGTSHMVVEMTNKVSSVPVCYDTYAWPVGHPEDPFVKPLSYFDRKGWGSLLGRFYFKTA